MASSSSSTRKAMDGESLTFPFGGSSVVPTLLNVGTWNPFSSPDWDKETHTKDALFRIKRFQICPRFALMY